VKAARTVWSRGKVGDHIKDLPMAIGRKVAGHQAAHGWRWRRSHWHYAHSLAVHPVLIKQAQLNRKVVEYWAVS